MQARAVCKEKKAERGVGNTSALRVTMSKKMPKKKKHTHTV